MLKVCIGTIIALATATTAAAAAPTAEPTGEWAVEGDLAHVQIENCSGQLWGVVSWEKSPGTDSNNPDPSKRTRPTLGMPILLGMTPADSNRWDGEIYNSNDGKTYSAHIGLVNKDTLRVEGCVLGFLCGGQNWTRVKQDSAASMKGTAIPSRAARTQAQTTGSAQGSVQAQTTKVAAASIDVCAAANDAQRPSNNQDGWQNNNQGGWQNNQNGRW